MAEQTKPESAITDEMRASIGVEGAPTLNEVTTTGIRMFARAVGYTDQRFYDEAYAKSKGYRSLLAPPGYLGTAVYNPNAQRQQAAVALALGVGLVVETLVRVTDGSRERADACRRHFADRRRALDAN